MAKLIDTWNNLDASKKRTLVLIGVGLIVMFVLWGYVSNDAPKREKKGPEQPLVKAPLTGSKETSLGVEALAAKLTRLESELKSVKGDATMQTQRLQANFDQMRSQAAEREQDLKLKLESASKQITALEKSLAQERSRPAPAAGSGTPATDGTGRVRPQAGRSSESNPGLIESEWALFDNDATTAMTTTPDPTKQGARGGTAPAGPPPVLNAPKIQAIGTVESPSDPKAARAAALKSEVTIPSGSLLKGVLITGVDAPTGSQARQSPMPALLRVKHEGILPNFASWDVTECFILLSGYGDISTERYMARAERLSCVSDQKEVLDVTLEAYAAGEDGKAGIRGRLVTRMGAALLNSGIAGFFSGAAQAFAPQRLPTITQTGQDSVYTPSVSTVLNTGAGQGASTALSQIAEFYIKLAEQTLPVVEIDAAREVELILVRPLTLPSNTAVAKRR